MRTLIFSGTVIFTIFLLSGQKLPNFKQLQHDVASIRKTFDSLQEDTGTNGENALEQNKLLKTMEKYREEQKMKTEELDPEVRRMMENINKEIEEEMNPLAKKLMGKQNEKKQVSIGAESTSFDYKTPMFNFFKGLRPVNETIGQAFFFISSAVFLMVVVTRTTSVSFIGAVCAQFGFKISRLLIFGSALAGGIVYFSAKVNVFNSLSLSLLWGPLLLMVSSAFSLKIYDFNNPVWNRMFTTLIWPITSGLLIRVF